MTKKQVKVVVCVIQALLIGMLFLPSARASGSNLIWLNTFDLVHKYAQIGLYYDSMVYIVLAVCCPVVTVLSLFLLHERKNFGVGACVCALMTLVHACFYSSVKSLMAGTVTVTGLEAFMVFLAFVAVAIEIYGYLLAGPPKGKNEKKEP